MPFRVNVSMAWVNGQLVTGYRLPWSHEAVVHHDLYGLPSPFHYHEHEERPSRNQIGVPRLLTNPPGKHHVVRRVKYATHLQFYRKHD